MFGPSSRFPYAPERGYTPPDCPVDSYVRMLGTLGIERAVIVHGNKVTCPLHNWVFSLETGEAQGADTGRIATYPVRIEGERILIDGVAVGKKAAA